ncbi:unnamed protein product [Parajaminaea phylloscopi]
MPLLDQLQSCLEAREAKGMLRRLTVFEPSTISSTSQLADFSSNDYLSIATSEDLKRHFMERAHTGRIGGSTGSRLLDGNNGQGETELLEERLCDFFGAPSALLCPSGWEANVSVFSTLPQKGDVVLYDSLIHASVHDGMRRARAKCVEFRHNDAREFEERLKEISRTLGPDNNVFLAVEALYSMDGDFACLPELLAIARRYFPSAAQASSSSTKTQRSPNFWVIVDEAHSSGCLGANGAGMCQKWGLAEMPELIRVCTFGKGFGASGAVILSRSNLIRQYLINYARPLIFSTSLPHAGLLLIHAALDVLVSASAEDRRQRLMRNCSLLRSELEKMLREEGRLAHVEGLLSLGTDDGESVVVEEPDASYPALRAVCNAAVTSADEEIAAEEEDQLATRSDPAHGLSPIMPLLTPHAFTRPMAMYLQGKGYLVRPITYPTVPAGRDRLRICVHADNTPQQIRGLAEAIRSWIRENRHASQAGQTDATANGAHSATTSSPPSPRFRITQTQAAQASGLDRTQGHANTRSSRL